MGMGPRTKQSPLQDRIDEPSCNCRCVAGPDDIRKW